MQNDLIALTIHHLKQAMASVPWVDVKEIDSLTQVNDKQVSTTRTPTLYVFLVDDAPKPDVRGTGAYLQSCIATVGVVIEAKSINGKPIDFMPIRQALRQRLFGWSGNSEYEPYWLGRGRMLGVSAGRATWLDQFVTEYTEDQLSYGS
ncbi:phage tail terminator protein [Vibrio nomapromontoriensis]|uniref:phage tail terminator protein n=1 Tax=Vibrio nomapromontoriensis TaxID=2910246 RepID=UPI003D13BAFC